MGCFSFMCKHCGKAVLSSSFDGDPVTLYLLLDGKVIEQMEGEYDSYGRVFKPGNKDSYKWKANYDVEQTITTMSQHQMELLAKHTGETKESLRKQFERINAEHKSEERDPWKKVCDLMFSSNEGDGIAAVHVRCKEAYGKIPTTKSADDPNQGWGDNGELMGATSIK